MPPPKNIEPMDTESRQHAHTLLEFCRELGLTDFYRGKNDLQNDPQVDTLASPDSIASPLETMAATAPEPPVVHLAPSTQEDTLDMARKTANPYPPNVAIANTPALLPAQKLAALQSIREEIGDCTRCTLCEQRNKIVFGDGDPTAELMFVGEGPGADEDEQGLPFVGRGGQLLNNMIVAMGLSREQVYIANVVKCRPPQNRVPEFDEATTCTPFLFQQIDVIRPRLLVALGATAATYLLGMKSSLSSLRGRIHDCRGTKLVVTYHPAYLLRDPRQKPEAWKDLQLAMKFLGLKPPPKAKS